MSKAISNIMRLPLAVGRAGYPGHFGRGFASTRVPVYSVMDGNTAAAHVAYSLTEQAFIYPISPSTQMCELAAAWAAQGMKNAFGTVVKVTQMQSEGGAAGSLHGVLDSGSLATTFTCSQGLLLMIPNMYIIAGQLSPCVFHVTARALSKHGLSIYAEHTDVMAVRQTGWSMISSATVQECMDMAAVAHLSSLKSSVPFLHFFDGYRVSHELNKVQLIDYEDITTLIPNKELSEFRSRGLSPLAPHARACNTGSDIFFQGTEAVNKFYDNVPSIVQSTMDQLAVITGRHYSLFEYAGPANPQHVIITMGSSFETVKNTIYGPLHGAVNVRLFRPWSSIDLMAAIPESVTRITVLDRTKDAGGFGEPLFVDVAASLHVANRRIEVVGGRYGLGSKEFLPSHVLAIMENGLLPTPKTRFTVGIVDDVTFRNLPLSRGTPPSSPAGMSESIFFGMASDGTVSANKNAVHLIGKHTDLFVQAHVWNDSKKAGGATISHLRISPKPISMPYEIVGANFVAVSESTWPRKFPGAIMSKLAPGGTLLLNTHASSVGTLEHVLPREMTRLIAEKNIQLYTIDARAIAASSGLRQNLINNVMQAAFFKLALGNTLPFEKALPLLVDSIKATYAKQGNDIVAKNVLAAKNACAGLHKIEIPDSWANNLIEQPVPTGNKFYDTMSQKLGRMEGDELPVSQMDPYGRFPTGMTVYEKRGIAASIPIVDMDKCTQCNLCSIICPHAAIRPFLLSPNQVAAAPFTTRPAMGGPEVAGFHFRIQVSPLDCTGCEACSWTCPDDALKMVETASHEDSVVSNTERENWDFAIALPERVGRTSSKDSPRTTQLALPMLEFSGACAGCGETPYAKLVTQLFGERMLIANASGCSGVWGAAAGFSSYTKNEFGEGPAWGRSLYEDAAEYGLGMATAVQTRRKNLRELTQKLLSTAPNTLSSDLELALWQWTNGGYLNATTSQRISRLIKPMLAKELAIASLATLPLLQSISDLSGEFVKTAVFVFGGDGFAYDIGFGGIDHVIASGTDLNIVIFDTEGYANTSGQVSKATPIGAVQKFASDGRRRNKKSLAEMAMSYGDVYVATVAIGANASQSVKAFKEAEAYPGPSLVLCYSPCIEHKIKYPRGLSRLSEEMTLAVNTGYWPLFRFHPLKKFVLDAPKRISIPVTRFTEKEDRFGILERTHPEAAASLAKQLQEYIYTTQARLLKRAASEGDDKGSVLIAYASETGNTAELAARMKQLCFERGVRTDLLEMTEIESLDILSEYTHVLFMTSTAGEGAFPSMACEFWALLNQGQPLGKVQFSVFGLGDTSYRLYNESAKQFDFKLSEIGATRFCPMGLGNDRDVDKYETGWENWLPAFWTALGVSHDPTVENRTAPVCPALTSIPRIAQKSSALVPRKSTFELEVVQNRCLTPLDYDRSIFHVTLRENANSAGDLSYLLGDVLSIVPRNDLEKVNSFMAQYGIDPNEAVLVSSDDKRFEGLTNFPITATDLLIQITDLFGKPTKFFWTQLAYIWSEASEKPFSTMAEALLSTRDRLDLNQILQVVPLIKPRLYSIASSYGAVNGAVDLLVVHHEWTNEKGTVQSGLASSFIKSLKSGDRVLAGISGGTFHLPASSEVPMVMAGLGTGMAPFRSFIQERAWSKTGGRMLLFYGCRHKDKDFAFKEELGEYANNGVIDLLAPAFSRDQAEKIYIQQRIIENADAVYKALVEDNGYFYLCGQAGHMADEVEEALVTAFVKSGKMNTNEAIACIANMKDSNRYGTELY